MKRIQRKSLRLLLFLLAIMTLCACTGTGKDGSISDPNGVSGEISGGSSGGTGAEDTVSGTGLAYVPEYRALEEYPDWMDLSLFHDGFLHGVCQTVDPETGRSADGIARWDLETGRREDLPYLYTEGNIKKLAAGTDGGITLLVYGSGKERSDYGLVLLNERGEMAAELPLEDLPVSYSTGGGSEDSYSGIFPQALAVDQAGNIYLQFLGIENVVAVLDGQGHRLFDLTDDSGVMDLVTGQDGKVYGLVHDIMGGYGLKEIDADRGSWGETCAGLPGGVDALYAEDETHYLISSGDILYRYDRTAQSAETVLNWLSVDIDEANLQGVAVLEDGRIVAIVRSIDLGAGIVRDDMVYLTEVEASQVRQKQVIVYGVWGELSRQMRQQVIDFNKTNEAYRIEVRDYLAGKGLYYLNQGIQAFQADLAAGTGPDLIDLTRLEFSDYVKKGVFADLNAFLKKDPELSREDLAAKALTLYEWEDGLYGMPLFFAIRTMVGRTETLQGLSGWTVADVQRILSEQPEEMAFLDQGSREGLLSMLAGYQLDHFIDWEEGTCRFDSREFTDLMQFAAECPFAADLNEPRSGSYARIHAGQVLVTEREISLVSDYQMTLALYDQDAVTMIGYPTADGTNGSLMTGLQPVAILASSDRQEGAWAFVRFLLSEEYQNRLDVYGFPVLQSALDACMERAMAENSIYHRSYVWDDFEYEQVPATKEEIDGLRELIESARPMTTATDSVIMGIISEESAAFFAGQKTAEQVAEIIQSRVSIYVSEQSS